MAQLKSEELQKKHRRLEKEYQRATDKYTQAKEAMEAKEMEVKRVEADILAALLVENGLNMDELTQLVKQSKQPISESNLSMHDVNDHGQGGM
ncbi:hypothetical protein AAH973_13630 [Enterococcus faecalis]|uniref:hypothetical protein n=1 Tax=Enterococcus faecalis TaxID=1351 RepID=UPI0019E2E04D